MILIFGCQGFERKYKYLKLKDWMPEFFKPINRNGGKTFCTKKDRRTRLNQQQESII